MWIKPVLHGGGTDVHSQNRVSASGLDPEAVHGGAPREIRDCEYASGDCPHEWLALAHSHTADAVWVRGQPTPTYLNQGESPAVHGEEDVMPVCATPSREGVQDQPAVPLDRIGRTARAPASRQPPRPLHLH